MNGNGDDVPLRREDDIAQDLVVPSVCGFVGVHQKGFWIKIMELDESGPIVR